MQSDDKSCLANDSTLNDREGELEAQCVTLDGCLCSPSGMTGGTSERNAGPTGWSNNKRLRLGPIYLLPGWQTRGKPE